MKQFRVWMFLALVGWTATDAWAQMGLYGSPEPLPLQPNQGASFGAQPPACGGQMPVYGGQPQAYSAPQQAYGQPPQAYGGQVAAGYQATPAVYTPTTNSAPMLYRTSAETGVTIPACAIPGYGPLRGSAPAAQAPGTMPDPTADPTSQPTVPGSEPMMSPGCTGSPGAPCAGNGDACDTNMPRGGYLRNRIGGDEGCDCGGCCCGPWYGGLRALYMTRDKPNTLYTSYEASTPTVQGHFDNFDWGWGGEATIGYRFGCCGCGSCGSCGGCGGCGNSCGSGQWGIESTYWGFGEKSSGGPGIPGPYSTPMTMGLTDIVGTGQQANAWTDNSPDHQTYREDEYNSIEVNFVRSSILCSECCGLSIDGILGVRYFGVRDVMDFSAQRAADGSPYAGDWLHLDDQVHNQLLGFQFGFNADWHFARNWKVFVTPKIAICDNHMTLDSNLYAIGSQTGTYYQGSSQTYPNQNYPIHSSTDGFSLLSQVDVGLDWQMTQRFSAQIGYRLVGITGVGLADNQVPPFANDTQAIAQIDRNGSMVLNGAFAGFTFCF